MPMNSTILPIFFFFRSFFLPIRVRLWCSKIKLLCYKNWCSKLKLLCLLKIAKKTKKSKSFFQAGLAILQIREIAALISLRIHPLCRNQLSFRTESPLDSGRHWAYAATEGVPPGGLEPPTPRSCAPSALDHSATLAVRISFSFKPAKWNWYRLVVVFRARQMA
jgi:hypothetical protein